MPNRKILRQALQMVKDNPSHWDQTFWHCGTSHCFGGMIDLILVQLPIWATYEEIVKDNSFSNFNKMEIARFKAMGLSNIQYSAIICSLNSLDDLEFYVNLFCSYLPDFLKNYIVRIYQDNVFYDHNFNSSRLIPLLEKYFAWKQRVANGIH